MGEIDDVRGKHGSLAYACSSLVVSAPDHCRGSIEGLLTFGAEETAGAYSVMIGEGPPGSPAPALHEHPTTDEAFYVAAGEASFQLEDEQILVPAGAWSLSLAEPFTRPGTQVQRLCAPDHHLARERRARIRRGRGKLKPRSAGNVHAWPTDLGSLGARLLSFVL